MKDIKDTEVSKEEALQLIKKHLSDQIDLIRRQRLEKANFASPSWPYYQATLNGAEKAYIKLLTDFRL